MQMEALDPIDTIEELAFLCKLISEMSRQFDLNHKGFQTVHEKQRTRWIEMGENGKEKENGKISYGTWSELLIYWHPYQVNDSDFKHIHKIKIKWTPCQGDMYFSMLYEEQSTGQQKQVKEVKHTYSVGWYPGWLKAHKELKLEFIRLYKKIQHFEKIEAPKQQKEKVLSAIFEMFPSIMDDVLLGEIGDEKKD
jgi:hypothetical protein